MAVIAIVGRPNVGKSTLSTGSPRAAGPLSMIARSHQGQELCRTTWTKKASRLSIREVHKQDMPVRPCHPRSDLPCHRGCRHTSFRWRRQNGLHPEDSALFDTLRRTSKPIFFSVTKLTDRSSGSSGRFLRPRSPGHLPISSAHGLGWETSLGYARTYTCPPDLQADEEAEVSEIRVCVLDGLTSGNRLW